MLYNYNHQIPILIDRHKKRFNTESGRVLVDCENVFNAFNIKYQKAVEKEGFGEPDNVIPMEPFITCKAQTFLRDVLLGEKLTFGSQGQGNNNGINVPFQKS